MKTVKLNKKKITYIQRECETVMVFYGKTMEYRAFMLYENVKAFLEFNCYSFKNANITVKIKKILDFFFLLCYLKDEMKIKSIGECYGFF